MSVLSLKNDITLNLQNVNTDENFELNLSNIFKKESQSWMVDLEDCSILQY